MADDYTARIEAAERAQPPLDTTPES